MSEQITEKLKSAKIPESFRNKLKSIAADNGMFVGDLHVNILNQFFHDYENNKVIARLIVAGQVKE